MVPKVRPSKRDRAIYVEHGVWYDSSTKNIHVTISGQNLNRDGPGPYWSYNPRDKQYAIYEQLLRLSGRWPEGARSAEVSAS